MKYYDKNGTEIQEGMHLLMEDGTVEKIYSCMGDDQEVDLGINASNEQYLIAQGLDVDINREIYPLSQFSLKNAEVYEQELERGVIFSPTM